MNARKKGKMRRSQGKTPENVLASIGKFVRIGKIGRCSAVERRPYESTSLKSRDRVYDCFARRARTSDGRRKQENNRERSRGGPTLF